ncbi:MAG: tetratricopeptide repeat protein, partial [Nitrospinales bacterium]
AVYLVGLLPFTNLLPRSIYLADRYEYLASIGFCTAAAALLCGKRMKNIRRAAAISIILMWTALCADRVAVWRNSSALWADINDKRIVPSRERHLSMANAYTFDGRWEDAIREFDQADTARTGDPKTLLRMANTLQMAGQDRRAEALMEKILRERPDNLGTMRRLIVLHIRKKRYEKAEERLRIFQSRMPARMASALRDLIRHDKSGEFEQAARVYRELSAITDTPRERAKPNKP